MSYSMKQYLSDSGSTCSSKFYLKPLFIIHLVLAFSNSIRDSLQLDWFKKAIFYGKTTPVRASPSSYPSVGNHMMDLDHDLLHAVIGIATESGELSELLLEASNTGKVNRVHFKEEAGDILWYLALLFRNLDMSFEEVAKANIEKLKIRYPNKFDSDNALSRNRENEINALENN